MYIANINTRVIACVYLLIYVFAYMCICMYLRVRIICSYVLQINANSYWTLYLPCFCFDPWPNGPPDLSSGYTGIEKVEVFYGNNSPMGVSEDGVNPSNGY